MKRTIKYDLAKYNDCFDSDGHKLGSFTISTTDGSDEAYAAKQAEARGTGMTEELIRWSILSYEVVETIKDEQGEKTINRSIDTREIKGGFLGFDQWSTKARNFVVAAWKKLSTPDEKEIEDFFANATEIG